MGRLAILVVDMQEQYLTKLSEPYWRFGYDGYLPSLYNQINEIARFLAQSPEQTLHVGIEYDYTKVEPTIDALTQKFHQGTKRFKKNSRGAFSGFIEDVETTQSVLLSEYLEEQNVISVVVAGVVLDQCIHDTIGGALAEKRFRVFASPLMVHSGVDAKDAESYLRSHCKGVEIIPETKDYSSFFARFR